ncbi:MAG TPA: hypothetical protein DCY13_11565 [Verrucomicrobiales bacterium]|nr:hypothetical protein [Verrucomicrobiales bacterium]
MQLLQVPTFESDARKMRHLAVYLATALCLAQTGPAVIFHSTDDPAYNTTAPTGALADSGWNLQGRWGAFLGTPIAPNLFITAKHVGGGVGGIFEFRGTNYTVIESFADPDSDLRIFKVCGLFPAHAPLYANRDEIGKRLVVFGRGTRRGVEVVGDSLGGPEQKGWRWGDGDGVMRWGENIVSTNVPTATGIGELLGAAFDAAGGVNEVHLSSGDSGGGVFIQAGGTWRLAGINYAVEGPFNNSNNGAGFNAAVFDVGGLYQKNVVSGGWGYNNDLPVNQPSSFYATRISGNLAWINSIIAQHAVSSQPPVLQSTATLGTPFSDHASYTVNEVDQTITLDQPAGVLFLRLRGCSAFEIQATEISNGKWILHYTR